MGKRAKELVEASGINVDDLIMLLNKAFADEWLAYYQYWIAAQVIEGLSIKDVKAELLEHAVEELAHAQQLANRIVELGGMPILEPKEWYTMTNCGYKAPTNTNVKAILQQNIDGERCAINVYRHILKITENKDPITYHMALSILSDELQHEEDLELLDRHCV